LSVNNLCLHTAHKLALLTLGLVCISLIGKNPIFPKKDKSVGQWQNSLVYYNGNCAKKVW